MRATIKPWVRNLVVGALLVLGACVPTSENPVKVPGQDLDKRLLGAWHGTIDDGGAIDLYFLKRVDGETYSAVFLTTNQGSDDHGEWAVFAVVTAEVKGTNYLSALWGYNDGEPVTGRDRGYHLMRYEIGADGTLSMHGVDEEKLRTAVRRKKLKGTIEKTKSNPDVRITASSEDLVAYLGKIKPANLFDQPFAQFKR